jgi:transcriptional regulator with XRE-family HTH domain
MIGQTVRRRREERGLSQEELALAARVSSGYLSKLERGLAQPSAAVLQRLAGALAVPLADLYTAAGLGHLLDGLEPDLDPALELYVHQIDSLPQQDRAIIIGVLQDILAEERAHAAAGAAPDQHSSEVY